MSENISDMTNDLTEQWEKFNLLDVECVGVDIPEQEIRPMVSLRSSCVVGKLLANRIMGKEIIKTPLIRA